MVAEVPVAFRGGWDELSNGSCADREPRYSIGARRVSYFETPSRIERITTHGPNRITLHLVVFDIDTGRDMRNAQGQLERDTWRLQLVDNGAAITDWDAQGTPMKKCGAGVGVSVS